MLLDERLSEIKVRCDAATEGPWKVFERIHETDKPHLAERAIGTAWDHPQLHGSMPVVTLGTCIYKPNHRITINEYDAEFIANARKDIPFLIEEVERLRAALYYVGHYNRGRKPETAHLPNTEKFHIQEVARENLECNVDYTDHVLRMMETND
ncbi:hypothetical protein [Bacillus sp. 1P06AnD]|uniref:hypothetical protein n=1 Tax=Bacillus sp. 1P06AnD TaxID=3132208 RepID=UPI0039A35317